MINSDDALGYTTPNIGPLPFYNPIETNEDSEQMKNAVKKLQSIVLNK